MKHKGWSVKMAAWVNYLLVSVFCLGFLFPLYFFFTNAFKQAKFISTQPLFLTAESFTLDNIIQAFARMKYLQAFQNSFVVLIVSSVVMIVLGSMAAYAIVAIGGRWLNRLFKVIMAMMTIPVYVAMIPLSKTLAKLHLINSYFGIAFVYIAFALPFVIFLYVGNMQTIPKELSEAATIDGCNLYQTYLLIYMHVHLE